MSILLNYMYGRGNERLLKEFSYQEVGHCYGQFRHTFKEELLRPTADNNALLAYEQQLRNLLVTHTTLHAV